MSPEQCVRKSPATSPDTAVARRGRSVITPQRLTVIVAMLSVFPVNADELVDRADANGDGYVSLYELRAAYYADMEFNQRIEQSFADYDTDGDGLISEAERRAQAIATTQTAPETAPETIQDTAQEAGMAAAASGERALTPAAGTTPATAAGMASTPAAVAVVTTATETASTPAAETVSAGTPGMDTGADSPADSPADNSARRSPEAAPAAAAANGALPDTRGLSRTELWIEQIDVNNSGGASIRELVASGDGSQWFSDSDFASADENGDGDLDPDELEVLLQSMERRSRR